jgi:hypothetical protein
VEHESIQPRRGANTHRHSDGPDNQQLGIGRSIPPRTAGPLTVLVADMWDVSLLLEGWRDGPRAYLSSSDATPLRRQLAAAFGSTELARCGDPGEAL